MSGGPKTARIVVTIGSIVLLLSAAMHCIAYQRTAPVVGASNLSPALKAVFSVAFLSMAWGWLALGILVLLAAFSEARLRKPVILICGFSVLIQAILTVPSLGFFIGNETLGVASIFMIVGGFLFDAAPQQQPR